MSNFGCLRYTSSPTTDGTLPLPIPSRPRNAPAPGCRPEATAPSAVLEPGLAIEIGRPPAKARNVRADRISRASPNRAVLETGRRLVSSLLRSPTPRIHRLANATCLRDPRGGRRTCAQDAFHPRFIQTGRIRPFSTGGAKPIQTFGMVFYSITPPRTPPFPHRRPSESRKSRLA